MRIVRTILKVADALKSDPKRDLGEGICKSYLEMMEGYMMMKNKTFVTSLPTDTGPGLFDPNLFKANKEVWCLAIVSFGNSNCPSVTLSSLLPA